MREFLKGLELDDETINTIMAEHGKLVTKDKEQITTLTKQVEDANKEIKSYQEMDIDSIKKSASDWETKYNELVNNQKAEREKSIREERANAFFNDVKFSSEMAKAGVMGKFNEKEFKYDEETETFQGAKEWLEELKKNDTGSFMSDVANPYFSTLPGAQKQSMDNDEIRQAMGLKTNDK